MPFMAVASSASDLRSTICSSATATPEPPAELMRRCKPSSSTWREPFGAFAGKRCELAALADVVRDLNAQLHHVVRRDRGRRVIEVMVDGKIELIARCGGGIERRLMIALQVLDDGAIVGLELAHDGCGAARLGLGLKLHVPQRLHREAGVLSGKTLTDQDHGGDRRKSQRKARPDPEAKPRPPPRCCGRGGCQVVLLHSCGPHKT